MSLRTVGSIVGIVVALVGVLMALAGGYGLLVGEEQAAPMLLSALAVVVCGGAMARALPRAEPTSKDAYGVVAFGWIAASLAAALPFLTTGAIRNPVDALFETVSGLTTTGATVLADVENLPACVQLWRCGIQWIGGLGILLVVVIVLPFFESFAARILRAEAGLPSERIRPRLRETGLAMTKVYLLFTLAELVLLRLGGLKWFDAVCHALTTMPTGGFSPHNESIGAFASPYVRCVITFFMFAGATNFVQHYRFLSGDWGAYFRSERFRLYVAVLIVVSAFVALDLWRQGRAAAAEAPLRALFHVVSYATTTGYVAEDLRAWSPWAQFLLVACMVSFGMSGSTTGGIKLWRLALVVKMLAREIGRVLYPNRVVVVKMDGEPVEEATLRSVAAFVFAYAVLLVVTAGILSVHGRDFVTAWTAAASCLGNVGPAFGELYAHYGGLTWFEKVWLTAVMLVGRLEIFGFVVLFSPGMWRYSARH